MTNKKRHSVAGQTQHEATRQLDCRRGVDLSSRYLRVSRAVYNIIHQI
jgi:hypothetical protein